MERSEGCYLCGAEAVTPRGTAYYRFFNVDRHKWASEAICLLCLTKLKGPIVKDGEDDGS